MRINEKYRLEVEKYAADNAELLKHFSDATVLVTGGAGLIGTYIIDILLMSNKINGFSIGVVALDRNADELEARFGYVEDRNFRCCAVDLVSEDISSINADYIIHAASNTSPIDYAAKPIDTIRCNAMGTDKLLEHAAKNGIRRFLFCSSVEAYGAAGSDIEKFTEDYSGFVDSNSLRAAYPSSKRLGETLCNAYGAEYGLDFCIGRIGRIFGPTVLKGDAKAPTQFIVNAINKEDIVLKSDGMQLYSYGYVGDCAAALLAILALGESGEAYNISSEDLRLRDFAARCAQNAGKELVFQAQTSAEKKGYSNITKAILDTGKLEALGFKPVYSVYEGIDRTIEYLGGLI